MMRLLDMFLIAGGVRRKLTSRDYPDECYVT